MRSSRETATGTNGGGFKKEFRKKWCHEKIVSYRRDYSFYVSLKMSAKYISQFLCGLIFYIIVISYIQIYCVFYLI